MNKKKESMLGKWFFVLAICSVVVAFVEGLFYYTTDVYPNPLFRFMLIIQNCIKAFEFKADISLKEIAKSISESEDAIKNAVAYVYAVSLFVAPYCTLLLVYKVMARIFKIRTWRFFPSKDRRIVVFGYNDVVKALLKQKSQSKEKRRIHLVATNVSEKDEIELIKNKIILHQIDCLGMASDQVVYFSRQMELQKATDIILFEESSARNFSLYNMLHGVNADKKIFKEDVKFFCRCEDDGIKRIIEDYYDTRIRDKKTEKDPKKKAKIEVFKDLEIVSIPELRIRKMLNEHPLHSYHLNKNTENLHDWNLHLLIVGFGKLGQQLLLQAMNQGVVTSKNNILIDVVDFNIDEKRSIFANNFDNDYVCMKGNEYIISSDDKGKADGEFKIRFHKMDIRYKQFYDTVMLNGNIDNGGLYTYIAICVSDADISLHCMSEIERYLRTVKSDRDVSLGIRLETDRQMANYLNSNTKTYSNVFAIEEKECTITMDDLLMDNLDADAKEYNSIYNHISLMTEAEYEKCKESKEKMKEETKKEAGDVNKFWRELELFRRNSNRALANHRAVKKIFFERIDRKEKEDAIGVNGTLIKDVGDSFIIVGTMDEFVEKQSDSVKYPWISEASKLEHRRWCYFMASCGWKRTDDPTGKKDDVHKENPCLCTWDELKKYNPHMCCYDLLPIILEYKKNRG